MIVKVKDIVCNPAMEGTLQQEILTEALQQLARRVARLNVQGQKIDMGDVALEMPVPLGRVTSGYYTPRAAASFIANRLFKQVLPHLGSAARLEDVIQRGESLATTEDLPEDYAADAPLMTVDMLRSLGLTPKWSLELHGVRYHVSDPIDLGHRIAYVAFVEEGGDVKIRMFYESGSQGVWRSASHRTRNSGWIGKGVPHEESTDLPIPMIEQLSRRKGQPRQDVGETLANQVFYGLLEIGGHFPSFEGFYPDEARAAGTFSQTTEFRGRDYGIPDTFSFNDDGDAPDFSKTPRTFSVTSEVHGAVTAYEFTSKNGKLSYLIYKDGGGHCWVATIQSSSSAVTSRGAHREVIDAGNLTMPLYEYKKQIPPDYRGAQHPTKEEYHFAWPYIRELPMIQELYQSMGWTMPGGRPLPPPLPKRQRTFAIGDYARVPRTGNKISWGIVRVIAGGVATLEVPCAGNQTGHKDASVGALLPCYKQNEQVNVPGMAPKPIPGQVTAADYDNDRFQCTFTDPDTGQAMQVMIPGVDLDLVN